MDVLASVDCIGGILILSLLLGVMVTNTAADIHFTDKRVRNIWKVRTTVPFTRAHGLYFTATDELYVRACREGMHQQQVYIHPKPAYDNIATYTVQNFLSEEKHLNLVRCSGFPSTFYLRKVDEENYVAYWQGRIIPGEYRNPLPLPSQQRSNRTEYRDPLSRSSQLTPNPPEHRDPMLRSNEVQSASTVDRWLSQSWQFINPYQNR